MAATALRNTGISVVGDTPWGTHFCHFYESKEDLLDTLVPYFKAGLEDKEFCVWVIADPLTEDEARGALGRVVPDLDQHFSKENIEIFNGLDWYLKEGVLSLEKVTRAWDEKLKQALARGYDGMRVSGDTFWLRDKDWKDFCAYEKQLNDSITDRPMTVLCTYPLAKSGAAEILDVVQTHQFALTRRGGNWEVIEHPELKQAKQEIRKLNQELEQRVVERTRQLTAANERVEMILESITDKFFAFDKDWRFTYLNKHAEEQVKVLGKDPERLIGKVMWDEFPEAPNAEAFRRVMDERVVVNDELFYAPLGEWVENHICPSQDGGIVTFQKYVTERKRAEKTLLESERKFFVIFYKAPFAIALARVPDGFIVDINEAWTKMFGFAREEVVGKTSLELGINRDPLERALLFSELQERGSVRNREMTFFTKSGEARLISCNMDVVGFGGQRYLLSTMHDITEQKRAEEERRRSEEYLREGQRLSQTGSWAWTVASGDLFWSQEHYRIFGLDPDNFKLTTESAVKFIHPEDQSAANQAFERATSAETDFEWDLRIVRPDGTIRYIHSLAHPVFAESGELTEYVGTIMDTTERKLAEEALRHAQAELAHANRVLTVGELTASIAHELNQPLGAIVTNGNASVRLLSRDLPDLKGAREAIDCMISDAMRASEVIQSSRAVLKKAAPEKVPLDINEIIQEVIGLSASQLAKNQVGVRSELEADSPSVFGDRVQLQQVILNLILNANEAMTKPASQTRELVISSRRTRTNEMTVAVKDSGTGVQPEDQERIFDAFNTTKEDGLGLGLSISRNIIEAHGGRLWNTPNEGPGATFQFTLPMGASQSLSKSAAK
jgi:PAS domain S-box-containing protein